MILNEISVCKNKPNVGVKIWRGRNMLWEFLEGLFPNWVKKGRFISKRGRKQRGKITLGY